MSVSLQLTGAPFAYHLLLAHWLGFSLALSAGTACSREFWKHSALMNSVQTEMKSWDESEGKAMEVKCVFGVVVMK